MTEKMRASTESLRRGRNFNTIEKTARIVYNQYIDKVTIDKEAKESLRNNEKLHAEIIDLIERYTETDDETVGSIVARYHQY